MKKLLLMIFLTTNTYADTCETNGGYTIVTKSYSCLHCWPPTGIEDSFLEGAKESCIEKGFKGAQLIDSEESYHAYAIKQLFKCTINKRK